MIRRSSSRSAGDKPDAPKNRHAAPRLPLAALAICVLVTTVTTASENPTTAFDTAIKHYITEDYKKAEKSLLEAVQTSPDNSNYHLWLGRTYGRRAETSSGFRMFAAYGLAHKARAEFQRAVDLNPKNLDALESLFTYYLEAPGIVGGSDAKALEIAKQIEYISEPRGARAFASYYESRQKFDEAEVALERAREADPENIGHLLSHGSYLGRRGWFEKSDELFEEALERAPENPRAWHAYAKAIVRAKRQSKYDMARELLKRYLATPLISPDGEPYSKVRKLLKGI